MKFDKESYKRALNNIEDSTELRQKTELTNQKYKAQILSGEKEEDAFTGWDASNKVYDVEMLKITGRKKILRWVCLLLAGIVAEVLLVAIVAEDIHLRRYGEQVTAHKEETEMFSGQYVYKYEWFAIDYPDEYPEESKYPELQYKYEETANDYFYYEKNGNDMTLYFLKSEGETRNKVRPAKNLWIFGGIMLAVLGYMVICVRGIVKNGLEQKRLD
jgi:hypothetical protein